MSNHGNYARMISDFPIQRRARTNTSLATPCYYVSESSRFYEQSNSHDHRGNLFSRKAEKSTQRRFGTPPSKEQNNNIFVKNVPRFFTKSLKRSRNFLPSTQITKEPFHEEEELEQVLYVSDKKSNVHQRKPRRFIYFRYENMFKFIFIPFAMMIISIIFMLCIDLAIRPSSVKWRDRKLDGRECVLNFFIEKHPKDEYNPDFDFVSMEGNEWPRGKFEVISRFISSVAGTFRSKVHLQQHLIFTGTRDGGYLAEKAFQGWPKRGSRYSELHIIPADTDEEHKDSLNYTFLDTIEERFETREHVHIYSRDGLAGLRYDKDGKIIGKKSNNYHNNFINRTRNLLPYPDLQSFLPKKSDDEVIPYLHIDGKRMANQFEILMSSVPLLKSKKVSAIGVEHSLDMNVLKLIKFFDSFEYKTFFLGSRQLARIDNLCPETLLDVLHHPMINPIESRWPRTLQNWLRGRPNNFISNEYRHPPFFVALPRGRLNQEEMAIQHTYDLFGGFDSEKEIKTANDRHFNVK